MNDKPLHLSELKICNREEYGGGFKCEPSVTVPIWVTQSSLDGMQTLIQFLAGLEAAGKGQTPGGFELIMFYRTLVDCIYKAERAAHDKNEDSKEDDSWAV